MIRYIKRLCTAMLLLLTTLSLAVAVELTITYFQSGMLIYFTAAFVAAIVSIILCNAVTSALAAELVDIDTERVLQNCGKTAENKLAIR